MLSFHATYLGRSRLNHEVIIPSVVCGAEGETEADSRLPLPMITIMGGPIGVLNKTLNPNTQFRDPRSLPFNRDPKPKALLLGTSSKAC